VSRGAALTGALLITMATPATWPLALAAFLLRGGILLVTIPIVVLPTPVGLGNVLAPWITPLALGSITVAFVAVSVGAVVLVLGWLVLGGWTAAALEAEAARIVARETAGRASARILAPDAGADDAPAASREPAAIAPGSAPAGWGSDDAVGRPGGIALRILAARVLAYLPLAMALAWASVRYVWTAYLELTNPSDPSVSVVVRVVRSSPDVLAVLVVAWMAGEIVGAVAARRIALEGDGIPAALRIAIATSVRHPVAALGRFWLPTLGLVVVLVISALAAAWSWAVVGTVLGGRSDPVWVVLAVVVFVAIWVVGLLLTAVACAWRAAVWTMADVLDRRTFGGSTGRRPGDWRPDPSSANV